MTHSFNTVGLIGKSDDPGITDTILAINEFLTGKNINVLLDEKTADRIALHSLKCVDRTTLGQQSDLVIVVGGDGTMLSAARTLCDDGVPLVGVNLGRLGFLADVYPDEAQQKLTEILAGDYLVEERFLLEAKVTRQGETIATGTALNDVVVHKLHVAHMIETDTYINDEFVHTHRSDGIITATPTGSTAYALSGGGPIIKPGLEALVIVPICPHTLSNRPIAVKSDSIVRIVLSETGRYKAQVTCDGQFVLELEIGDEVVIQQKEKRLQLLHPKDHNYYHILREKLHWAETPKY